MKEMVEIVATLSERLSDFGRSAESIEVINLAEEQNSWFTQSEICSSVEAIRYQMLNPLKFQRWVDSYPTLPCSTERRVAIIMAGNIPLVGLFDLLCTLAAGHQAWIKPSSKDRVLIEYICALLKDIEPSIPIFIYSDSMVYDAIIATGGSQANQYFESKFNNIKHLHRNNRHSIAVLSGGETKEQMDMLAEDIYSYSGLGCRNVAMIFSPKGSKVKIPSHPTNPKYHNNYLQTKALLSIRGTKFDDNGKSAMVQSKEFPQSLSTISIYEYDTLAEVEAWIEEHDSELQCIVSQIIKHPRQVDFGEAQHPTLFDYADGVDTMLFLQFND